MKRCDEFNKSPQELTTNFTAMGDNEVRQLNTQGFIDLHSRGVSVPLPFIPSYIIDKGERYACLQVMPQFSSSLDTSAKFTIQLNYTSCEIVCSLHKHLLNEKCRHQISLPCSHTRLKSQNNLIFLMCMLGMIICDS